MVYRRSEGKASRILNVGTSWKDPSVGITPTEQKDGRAADLSGCGGKESK